MDPAQLVEERGDPVVGLDLGGDQVGHQVQLRDEVAGEGEPVELRVGRHQRPEGPGGAVELAVQAEVLEGRDLAFEARQEDRELLAHGGGARRLPVGAREHGDGLGALRQADQGREHLAERREHDVLEGVAQHAGIRQVVGVLRGQAEVDLLDLVFEARDLLEPVLDEVLDRLDVVVDLALDGLDGPGVRLREAGVDPAQAIEGVHGEDPPHVRAVDGAQQRDQVLDLDHDPVAVEGELREVVREGADLGGIAAVERRETLEGVHQIGSFFPRAERAIRPRP
ncbi:hypothetical protein D3C86_1029940 [compost metagenome]